MISKHALQAFLSRKLDDYSWLKAKTKRGFLRRISQMGARPHLFKTPPYKHQLVSFYIGICISRFLFLLDMGLGKTKVVLDIFEYLWNNHKTKRALILVPNRVNVDGWREEVELHSRMECKLVLGTSKEKWEQFEEEADLFVTHYPGFVRMVTKKVAAKKKKGKKVLVPDEVALRRIAERFDMLIMDEIHKVKNHNTVTYKALVKLSDMMTFVFGMTGTPFGKDPQNLWPQFYIVDFGETLGTTLGIFREAFFNESFGFGGHRIYKLKKEMKDTLHQVIQNRSIRYEDHECTDMPKRVPVRVPITLTQEAAAYYAPTHDLLTVDMRAGSAKTKNNYAQLREICSGFVMWRDDEGVKNKVVFKDNLKLEALEELAEELPASRKMVIFHEYVESGRMIAAKLKELGYDCAQARGEIKDPAAEIRRFKDEESCRFLAANFASGGTGGNYQVANTVLFFESPSDPITRTQAEKRCTGARQKTYKRVYVYDFVTLGTVEEDIQESLEEGKNLFEEVVNGRRTISRPSYV